MNIKVSIIVIGLWILCKTSAFCQLTINVPEANILSGADLSTSLSFGTYSASVSILPSINIRSNNANFTNSQAANNTIPVDVARFQLQSIAGLNLLGASSSVTLSTSYGTLYTVLASVNLQNGPLILSSTLSMANNAWLAGTYNTTLAMETRTLLGVSNQISPLTQSFNLVVPAVLNAPVTIPSTSMAVNSLALFRQTGVSGSSTFTLNQTVPVTGKLRTNAATFSFTSSSSYKQIPNTAVNLVKYSVDNQVSPVPVSLSSTGQTLNPIAFAVSPGNKRTLNGTFSISATDLKAGFVQAGTYSIPLVYSWDKPSEIYPSGPLPKTSTSNLNVVVNDMGEISVNQSAVSLQFSTAQHYQTGVAAQIPSHLKLSKTTPYNVYVKASSSSFSSGANTLPLNILEIGPMSNQTGVNTIVLSSTPSLLINNADPVIDREVNLVYRIPPSKTAALLGKPNGAYITNIIYSFVAE